MRKVFAIIVIYNGMKNDWIQKCFDSILNSSVSCEIVAIDNHSSDDSVQFIKSNYKEVSLIESDINLGFGGANNKGLEEALRKGGEYFLLLNQDAQVSEDTIEVLIEQAQNNPEYGIISPMHLNGRGDALDFNFSVQIEPKRCKQLYSDIFLKKDLNKLYEAKFICAACWLLPKSTLKLVGGFNPTFFHYGEDDNYCHRIIYHKLKIGVYPCSNIFHDREDRAASKYDDNFEMLKRQYLRELSDPNTARINERKQVLMSKKIIYAVLRNESQVQLIDYKLQLIKNGYMRQALEHRAVSQSSTAFNFLAY
ncbi:glycosyltransferase family 2 protein [Sphingobacterium sp. MYb388]|uniref:glycosyltransferase family 2 protein n=1 Tax=Sphingobacterium sp. MYb388 TaxID=2745437 RepID=UPI0030A51B7F